MTDVKLAGSAAFPGASWAPALRRWVGWRGRNLLGIGALAVTYYVAAQVGYAFEFAGPVAAIVWLPVGVAISFLYLGGVGLWPGVLVGDLLVNDYSALPVGSAAGQTFGNLLEVLVATLLMRRLIPRGAPLASVRSVARMVMAIAAGATVSATVGALSLRLGAVIDTAAAVPDVWRTWWLGDFAGALIVVPVALAWYRPLPRHVSRARAVEAALMIAAVAAASEIGFRTHEPVAYLVFPTLTWAALRFGERGATLAVTLAVGFAVWNTTHDEGPFAVRSITHSVVATQLYLAVAALSTLFLVAVVTEREAFAARLAASRLRLVEATDTERRRLGRNLHDGAQQRLTALAIRLGLAAEDARRAPERGVPLLEEAGAEVTLAIDELRQIAHGIHPVALNLGLAAAIRSVADRSSVPVAILALPSERLDDTAEATAYYVLAEAATNAQRYAQASLITVRATSAPPVLRLEIVDDGVGGAQETVGFGLEGLRNRVEALGGSFEVDSPSGHGTRIAAVIPAARPDHSGQKTGTRPIATTPNRPSSGKPSRQ
ncbi:MAG TPA: MASE1 domain-containing protein [Solirubrobacteraceae bacterium]